jgi:DNA modification methylase
MKPLELINNRILVSSKEDGYILDLFGGSGSTLIASESTKRKCLIIEIDPGYCDIIVKRYINYKQSSKDIFLLTDNKKIPWQDISHYKPERKV